MDKRIILSACLAALLAGCTGEKPREEKPSDAVVEEKKEAPVPFDSSTLMHNEDPPAEEPKPVARPAVEKNVTIVGEVIDIASYALSGARGDTPAGKEMIQAAFRGGNPLGILEKGSGDVYIVTMRQANTSADSTLLPFAGMPVAVKGDVYRKGGQQLLVMSTIGKSIR